MNQFFGLAGAVYIREIVKIMKPLWDGQSYSGLITVFVSAFIGVAINCSIAMTNDTIKVGNEIYKIRYHYTHDDGTLRAVLDIPGTENLNLLGEFGDEVIIKEVWR